MATLRAPILAVSVALAAGPAASAALVPAAAFGNSGGREGPCAPVTRGGAAVDARGRLVTLARGGERLVFFGPGGRLSAIRAVEGIGFGKLAARGRWIHLLGRAAGAVRLLTLDLSDPGSAARPVEGLALPPRSALAGRPLPDGRLVVARQVEGEAPEVVAVDAGSGAAVRLFALPEGATLAPDGLDVDEGGDIFAAYERADGSGVLDRFSIEGAPRRGSGGAWPIPRPLRFSVAAGALWGFGARGEVRRFALDGRSAPGIVARANADLGIPIQLVRLAPGTLVVAGHGLYRAAWNGSELRYTARFGGVDAAGIAIGGAGHLLAAVHSSRGAGEPASIVVRWRADAAPTDPPVPVGESVRAEVRGIASDGARWWLLCVEEDRWRIGGVEVPRDALEDPVDLAHGGAAGAGWLYVLDRGAARVVRARAFTPGRGPVRFEPVPLPFSFQGPGALAASTDGWVVVADTRGVHAFSASGDRWRHPWSIVEVGPGEPFGHVAGLAVTETSLYVADAARHRLLRFDRARRVLLDAFGVRGAAGCDARHLDRPGRVAARGRTVLVADRGNRRILALAVASGPGADAPSLADALRPPRRPLEPAVEIPFVLPSTGRMSAAIYDGRGRLVRTLASAVPRSEGPQSLPWDGLDDAGRPVLAGVYSWKVVRVPELEAVRVAGVGQSGSPPYRTPDGRGGWGGAAGNVMDLARVEDDLLVLWGDDGGAGAGLIRMTTDGEIVWKRRLPPELRATHVAVAADGPTAWIAAASPVGAPGEGDPRRIALWRVDARTGRPRPYGASGPDRFRFFGEFHWTDPGGPGAVVRDLAVASGRVFVPSYGDGLIYVTDGGTGEILAAIPVERPAGIAIAPDERLYVIAGDRLVELDAGGAELRTVAEGLDDPWDLAVDEQGLFYVSERGAAQRVSVLSPGGRLMRRIGQPGGRRARGRFAPEGLRHPAGIAIGPDGHLYVAEDSAPRRFLRFSRYGALLREWYGSYRFADAVAVDPVEPEWIYADTGRDLIRYRLDYETGAWSVDACWPDAWTPRVEGPCLALARAGGRPAIRYHMGQAYWCAARGGVWRFEDEAFLPAASILARHDPRDAAGPEAGSTEAHGPATWADRDGDGCAEAEEVTPASGPIPSRALASVLGTGAFFDAALGLLLALPGEGIWRLPVEEWLEGTIPVYRWDRAGRIAAARGSAPWGSDGGGAHSAFAAEGALYVTGGRDASWIERRDPETGEMRWRAGRRARGFAAPGEVYGLVAVAGAAEGLVFAMDGNGQVRAWTADGLYVGALLEDTRRDPLPGPNTLWGERRGGLVFRHPRTGKVYLVAANDAIDVWEIRGIEPVVPVTGSIVLSEDRLPTRAMPPEGGGPRAVCRIVRPKGEIDVDGDPGDWPDVPALAIRYTAKSRAEVRLAHDGVRLYAAFAVRDPTPLENGGDDPGLAFLSGDALVLELGPALGADRARPAPGDARIVLARIEGRGAAALIRPALPGSSGGRVFSSAAGRLRIGEILEVPSAVVVFRPSPGGYTCEASIPLSVLGIARVDPDEAMAFDAVVFFGGKEAAGARWATGSVDGTDDPPTRMRFEPYRWGRAVFE